MKKSRSSRRTQQISIQVESLEGRALLSTIPTADQFTAYDQLNIERLSGLQAINDLRTQNESSVQQLVSDGSDRTQAILADLQAGGDRAADLAALRQVRTLMKQGQTIGSRIDHALLSQVNQLNRVFTTAHNSLRNGTDPATVEDRGITALDNVVNRSQTLTDNGDAKIGDLDNRILNTGPITPPPQQGVNQGKFVGTLTHMGNAIDRNTGQVTQCNVPLTSPFQFVSLFLNGNQINGPIEIQTFEVEDANCNVVATLNTVPGQSHIDGTVQATSGTKVPARGTLTAVFPGVQPITVDWNGTVDFDASGRISHVEGTLLNNASTLPPGVPVQSTAFGSFKVDRQD